MLFLRLLGGASLSDNGSPLTGPATQRHRLALLAVLASSRSRPQSRDKLVALLWPERDAEHARNLLNQSVHALRRAVGEAGIISVQDELRLDPAALACDVIDFEDAVAAGDFERAIGLYTDPFLDGFHLPGAAEFEHWADAERDRLRRSFARSLESLAEAAEERREWNSAVERWRALLAEEPYNSRLTLRLMLALDRDGDRAGAIQQARLHTMLLQQEFEAGPDPDVVALADRLRTEPASGDDRKGVAGSPPTGSHGGPLRTHTSVPARVNADEYASTTDLAPTLKAPPSASSTRKSGSARRLVPMLAAASGLALAGLTWWTTEGGTQGLFEDPPRLTSIAVLPFANMNPDGADEYFSDGMSEEIITALSKVEGLRVAARTSAFAFKGKGESVSEIGRQLGVGTILEGSVLRAGNRLRVTARLINVEDGYHLWAHTYDGRDLRDVFDVQQEIVQAIVGALRVELGGEATAMVVPPTDNRLAYDLYLKGRHAVTQRTGASLVQAIAYFEQAIEGDSSFAQAYAGLAEAYVLLPGYSVSSPSEAWPKGRAAAEQALALDSTLAEARTALGYGMFLFDWDWRAAEHEFRRAIAVNPRYASAHHWYGDFLAGRGDLEGYLRELRLAHALDPLSPQIGNEVGRALYALRRYDEAVTQLEQMLRADPAFAGAHITLGRVYIEQGRLADAIGELDQAVEFAGRTSFTLAYLAHAYGVAGRGSEAQRLLIELEGRARREYVQPTVIAIAYIGSGQYGRAFDWLDRAVAERDGFIAEHVFHPTFDPLRSHPRYVTLLQALGLK